MRITLSRVLWALLALAGVVYTFVADRPLEYVIGLVMALTGLVGLFLAVRHPGK